LRGEREALEEAVTEIGVKREEADAEELSEQLARTERNSGGGIRTRDLRVMRWLQAILSGALG
jgi:hypothetical protein